MIYTETDSIREVDPQRWDALGGQVASMSHRWLRAVEAHWPAYRSHYVLVEDEQGPYLAIVANTAANSGNMGWLGWWYQHLSLPVSLPFSSMCGAMVRPGVPLEVAMPQLEKTLEQLCRRSRRLFITLENVATVDLPAWQQAGFFSSPQLEVNVLDLPATYELYVESLSPKNRSELRRVRKRATESGVRLEVGPLADDSEQIYSLLTEVFAQHGTTMPFPSRFLGGLDREMPGEVQFVRGYVGDTLAGVSLCLLNGPTLWWPMAGLRYEIARPTYLYFLLMDEMIRWSIEHGIQRIWGGKTADREKQRHGFHLEERWLCYRSTVPLLNRLLAVSLPRVQRLLRH